MGGCPPSLWHRFQRYTLSRGKVDFGRWLTPVYPPGFTQRVHLMGSRVSSGRRGTTHTRASRLHKHNLPITGQQPAYIQPARRICVCESNEARSRGAKMQKNKCCVHITPGGVSLCWRCVCEPGVYPVCTVPSVATRVVAKIYRRAFFLAKVIY